MKQDSSWRKVLDKLLPEFLAFYFSEIHQAIDFNKGIEFLDKELRKKHFLLELYRRGLSRETIVALYEFIGVLMALPEAKDEELHEEINQTSEEKQMSILAIAERKGLEKGLEEGREEGRLLAREVISDLLEIKFGGAGRKLFDSVEPRTDLEALRQIRTGLKQAQTVAEAEVLIRAHARARSENGQKN